MNWLSEFARPKLKAFFGQRSAPEKLWVKCDACGEMIFHRDVEANLFVCPGCEYHMKIDPERRFEALFDGSGYEKIALPDAPVDPLKFRDKEKYADRLKDNRNKTGQSDTIITAIGPIGGVTTVVCIQNYAFISGSLGMAAGEAIIRSMETAVERNAPFIMIAASGGARMQEGILSLMQMPRTTIAVQMLRDAGLPYIVLLTNPTTGGVTASYGMLGDVHVAEPRALIGFAGPRIIEQTIREKLPEGFQTAEYLLEHGMVDMVVHRHDLRPVLARLILVLMKQPAKEVKSHALQTGKGNGALDEPAKNAAQVERPALPNGAAAPAETLQEPAFAPPAPVAPAALKQPQDRPKS